jgi:hypothetical protein
MTVTEETADMVQLAELASSGPVVLLDAGVVRDIAAALTGYWTPDLEESTERRANVLAAARIRLYGDRDRSGWTLCTTAAALDSALKRGDADWSVGMLPTIESFDDAPAAADVESLVALYRQDADIDAEAATTLATALLHDAISIVVARVPRQFRHDREGDLPERLRLLDPAEAVGELHIGPGEASQVSMPIGSALAAQAAWWTPAPI